MSILSPQVCPSWQWLVGHKRRAATTAVQLLVARPLASCPPHYSKQTKVAIKLSSSFLHLMDPSSLLHQAYGASNYHLTKYY